MTCRTGLAILVMMSCGGVASTVAAQPSPAPAKAQDAAPPAATFGMSSEAPKADTAKKEEDTGKGIPPRVPWRGTSVSWNNQATTTLLGVGRDNISDAHEVYSMSWGLNLNYFLVDQAKWSIRASVAPSFGVELTDGGTVTRRELRFDDLPLTLAYSRNLFSKDLWSTGLGLSTNATFPTSPISQNNGTTLVTKQRLSLSQGIPLAGKDAVAFKSFGIRAGFGWDHKFSQATTPVSDAGLFNGRNAAGVTAPEDQLSTGRIAANTISESIGISFSEAPGGMPLGLSVGFGWIQGYKPAFGDSQLCDSEHVLTASGDGCIDVPTNTDAREVAHATVFNVGINFTPIPAASLSVGYSNIAGQLGANGERREIFYSPGASFFAGITLHPDAIYERAIGPKRRLAERKNDKRKSL